MVLQDKVTDTSTVKNTIDEPPIENEQEFTSDPIKIVE